LMCRDALEREECCGCHFREEHVGPTGEPQRDDAHFAHVAAWQHAGAGEETRLVEPLTFETITPDIRSYQ
jgi:succinate dehydrogenase / fumarate reductase flavoprotein subunit